MADFYRLEYPDANDYYKSAAGAIAELPADYAWMNNEPTAGTRAAANGPQSGGHVEDGTLFVANENDAASANANRSHKALALSLDTLDNQLRRPISVPTHVDGSTGGTPLSSKTIADTEMVWLGTTVDYPALFQIVDSNGNEIIDASGVTCAVTASVPPPGDGGLLNGFAAVAVQLTIAPAVPTSVSYRIHYAKKGSLAEMPRDALTRLGIGGIAEIDGSVRKQLKDLHGNSLDWDAAWTTTVYQLARGGLNERYNREENPTYGGDMPDTGLVDTLSGNSGAGNWIRRSGPAPTVYIPDDDYYAYHDPMAASWKAFMVDTHAHHSGFVYVGGEFVEASQNYDNTIASFLHYGSARMSGVSTLYDTAYTYLPYDGDCSVGYDGGDTELYLDVVSPMRFTDGSTYTDLVTGLDVIDVYRTDQQFHRSLLVHRIKSSTRVYLRQLDGTKPGNIGTFAATLRWHPFKAGISDGAAEYGNYASAEASRLYGLTMIGPREHGTMPGPGAGLTSQSFGINVYSGTNLTGGTVVFRSGYVTRDITSEESAPQPTAFLMANGSWSMANLALTGGEISGPSISFADSVDFDDYATFGDGATFEDNIICEGATFGAAVGFNVGDVTLAAGVNLLCSADSNGIYVHNIYDRYGGTGSILMQAPVIFKDAVGMEEDLLIAGGKSISVDSINPAFLGAAFISMTVPVKIDGQVDISTGNPLTVDSITSSPSNDFLSVNDPLQAKAYGRPSQGLGASLSLTSADQIAVLTTAGGYTLTNGVITVPITGAAGASRKLTLEIDPAALKERYEYCVVVRGQWSTTDTLTIQLIPTSGTVFGKEGGSNPLWTTIGSSSSENQLFAFKITYIEDNGYNGGDTIFVELIGSSKTFT